MKRYSPAGYLSLTNTAIELFSSGDMEQIHQATLELLEHTGIYLESMEAVEILCQAGAIAKGHVVKIPEYMVEEAIRTSPGSLRLCGRDENKDISIQKGRTYFSPFALSPYVEDSVTGEYRYSKYSDLADATRVVDALDQYDLSSAMLGASDVPAEIENYYIFKAMISNTSKPMDAPSMPKEKFELLIEMGIAIAGSLEALQERPFFLTSGCPISPLSIPSEVTDTAILCAKNKLPFDVLSMSMSGGQAPVTLAGTLAVHNAEVLTGLILTQVVRPGASFTYASSTGINYLKNAMASMGCPEAALINAGVAKLAQMYNLPSYVAGT